MKAVPILSTKSVTFWNIDIFYWNISNKVAAIPPQCQRCCWLPVSWGRIVVSCHMLSLSGAQSSSFCGLTPKEHIDKPSFSHQQIQYFWNLFYWCTYTAAHLSASADLLLQFGEFLLVHTEFLHLKSKHKRCWKFTHIWLNIFKTAQTSIQYSTNLAILNTAPGLTANYPQIQKGTYLPYQGVKMYIKWYGEKHIHFQSWVSLKPPDSILFFRLAHRMNKNAQLSEAPK